MNKPRRASRSGCRLAVLSAVSLFCAVSESLADPVCRVAPELWDRPRTGRSVLAQDALKPCVAALTGQSGTKLLIHHGGGAEPVLQAEELRAWLVALAVEAGRIELVNDLKSTEPLNVEIFAAGRPERASSGAETQRAPSDPK